MGRRRPVDGAPANVRRRRSPSLVLQTSRDLPLRTRCDLKKTGTGSKWLSSAPLGGAMGFTPMDRGGAVVRAGRAKGERGELGMQRGRRRAPLLGFYRVGGRPKRRGLCTRRKSMAGDPIVHGTAESRRNPDGLGRGNDKGRLADPFLSIN